MPLAKGTMTPGVLLWLEQKAKLRQRHFLHTLVIADCFTEETTEVQTLSMYQCHPQQSSPVVRRWDMRVSPLLFCRDGEVDRAATAARLQPQARANS